MSRSCGINPGLLPPRRLIATAMDLAHLLAAIACRQSRIHCERRLIKFANREPAAEPRGAYQWYCTASSDRLHVTFRELPMPSRSKRRSAAKHLSSRDKVRAHRKRLRARGLRPIQLWVPDTRTAAFKLEAHRQSQVVAQSSHARRDQDFIDAISLQPGD